MLPPSSEFGVSICLLEYAVTLCTFAVQNLLRTSSGGGGGRARGGVVVQALCYRLEGRGFETS
jgi:hypothetical protein